MTIGNPVQGALSVDPIGVTLEASGHVLVSDLQAGTDSLGALFRVDPTTTGARTVVSDFGNPLQGPLGAEPYAVAVEASGQILVTDPMNEGDGRLFRVNPTTGFRTVLSDFTNPAQGPLGQQAGFGVAVEASGRPDTNWGGSRGLGADPRDG